jgi:hypothetical protein
MKRKRKENKLPKEKEIFLKNVQEISSVGSFFKDTLKEVKICLNKNQINKSIELLKMVSEISLTLKEFEEYVSTLMMIYRLKEFPKKAELEHIVHVLKNKANYRNFVIHL